MTYSRSGIKTCCLTAGLALSIALAGCSSANDTGKQAEHMDTSRDTSEQGSGMEAGQQMAVMDEEEQKKKTVILPEDTAAALLAGRYKELYGQFSSPMREAASYEQLKELAGSFTEGVEAFEPVSRLVLNGLDTRVWTDSSGSKGVMAAHDEEGAVAGLQVLHLRSYPETDGQMTSKTYAYPFEGEWLVVWGGHNELSNYHYAYESQRYAADLVKAVDGYSYKGDPKLNESYYAFGEPVLAPADGTVVHVKDDIPDNKPVGVMNEAEPAGNVVVIDHGGGEYSMLAHLQQGSAAVRKGDRVKRGDQIGRCGNSGNSSEPHIHLQVSDGADYAQARSLNIAWEEGELLHGQTVIGMAGSQTE
ncbi:M23 family metallopeptidase [Paenibacillus tarimensis]|uniref:M23 family metallopeptidase n=1 Tax=Paenibacillus tarimensis TaxID=416012 RepID=UPI001F157969|nr:M23 family metallopeptidase [Paenibacillus tarimensis]MCF2943525.1 M23 family metallopeptidase [Paenibacillus tarimensis]